MIVDFGKAGLLGKARQQPDKVRQVLSKIKTDGLTPTLEAVFNKLDQPVPLGYCNVGRVIATGPGVVGFEVGDLVVSNGKHAEAVAVPINLCARVPDDVEVDEAAFTVLGAIALQGIRLVNPTLGETVVVTGLGLIGLVTVQLLRAHGCRVIGLDFDPAKLKLAESFGAETVDLSAGADPIAAAQAFSRGRGVDAVIITASTKSNEPVHQAALMCRKRGRIVLVGVTGLELSRADFFEKELTFQVSCSYGPGRYDPNYEEKGQDYPVGFVRWTEQRNFEAVLDMMADGRVDMKPLISHRFALEDSADAYALVTGGAPSLGILIDYKDKAGQSDAVVERRTVSLVPAAGAAGAAGKAAIGFVGSGNYATGVLIPAFKAAGARLVNVASSAGVSGLHAGRKFGFASTTTDAATLLDDPEINALVVATRHDSHAEYVCRAIRARKHVFVEKPLALTREQLGDIQEARDEAISEGFSPIVMVGFNRRFAPQIRKVQQLLMGVSGPKTFIMTVNAGAIPADHWTHDPEAGGGRIIGEACHFIDLLRALAGASIVSHEIRFMDGATRDTATIVLTFADGSTGTVHYFANGYKGFPKERLEIFCAGRILQLDNFRKLTAFGWHGFSKMNLGRQDKGQKACAEAFVQAVAASAPPPIAFAELIETSLVAVALTE